MLPIVNLEGSAMNDPTLSTEDTYSEAETVARREAALKVAFATPHKPHEPIGKRKRVEATSNNACLWRQLVD